MATDTIELSIGGMTCASCAARIERKLNKLDGVEASVNYATEKARVSYAGDLTPADLVKVVEDTGYTAELPATPTQHTEDDPTRTLRQRLITSVVLSVPVVVPAMIPALQFTYWQWL